jgi:peptidoglycan/LPS O-acetylase OafA/YrhL
MRAWLQKKPAAPAATFLPCPLLPAPRPIDAKFSIWLDLFRWLGAFAVCASHVRSLVLKDYQPDGAWLWLARPLYWITGFGHEAVIIFFVLSGYLVGGEVLRALHRGDFDPRVYAVRRFARLYAVYPLALLLGAVWDNLGLHFFNAHALYSAHAPQSPMFFYAVADRLNLPTFAGNLVFLQDLIVTPFGSNSALWSLANEAWYYALFPLLAVPLFAGGTRRGQVAGLLLFAAGAWFVRGDMLACFALWLLGLAPHAVRGPLPIPAWLAPAAVATVLVLLRLHFFDTLHPFWGHLLLAAAFTLWLCVMAHRPLPVPGSAGLHRFLANFSYTLYLTHWPLVLLLAAALDQVFGPGYGLPLGWTSLGILFGLLGVAYLYAWGLARLTERHTPGLRHWLLGFRAAPFVNAQ